ncbi:MAG TPA: diguanylate cyclase [Gallionellaceae bacterium]|nr:diguanylate cyclase [Gallionellaceae bacterium]
MRRTLLIVDDEPHILNTLIRLFRNRGFYLLTASSGEEALRLLASNEVEVILTDQRMPNMTGSELLSRAKVLYPGTVRMVLSGYSDVEAITDAINRGNIYKFLLKPWDNDLLLANVQEAFDRFDLTQKGEQFTKIYENTVEGIIITDQNTLIQAVNPAFSNITGYQSAEVIGKKTSLLKSGKHDENFYRLIWERLNEDGKWTGEIWSKRKSGEIYPEWLNITAIRDDQGKVTQYVGLFSDVSEHKRNEERLHYLAYHDALTDLPNRLMFSEHLELAVRQAERNHKKAVVLLIDLDRFKNVNDSFGMELGDKLLIAVAERLKARLHKGDTIARMGGDEYTVLLPLVDDMNDVNLFVEQMMADLRKPFSINENELFIGASIGVSVAPQDGVTPDDILKKADSALYKAKEMGRNTFVFFAPSMNESAVERTIIENDLRRALERGEIEVFYQPKQRLETNTVIGMEALVRWNHPSRGLVSPSVFIGVAEDTGLIIALGKIILEEACRKTSELHAKGFSNLHVAVNLSAVQFKDEYLLDEISVILDKTGLAPRFLEIEITESAVMHDIESNIEFLVVLKRLGINLAIDDFGTGYSSLSYLKRLPVDFLKIDQSFVRDVNADLHSAELVRTIIAMAHGLKLEVIAEGVETLDQLEFLRHHGCDIIQGYYLSRPLSFADFETFMTKSLNPEG